jgi:hypothetical protein
MCHDVVFAYWSEGITAVPPESWAIRHKKALPEKAGRRSTKNTI